ncbi:MAG: NAD(P)H-binding protein [Methanosarcina sp.]
MTATIIGATGLIGSNLLEIILNDENFKLVRLLVRKPVYFDNPKVSVNVLDFSDPISFKAGIEGSDAVFCAVGTTRKKVKGDKTAYRKVDYYIPVNAARICEKAGCPRFLLVSSVGADSKSSNFYLQLKGEVEDILTKLKIRSVVIFRPSILLGKRNEFRFGEKIGQTLSSTFPFLLPAKYKPVKAHDVAKAMVGAVAQDLPGVHIYQYDDIKRLSENLK